MKKCILKSLVCTPSPSGFEFMTHRLVKEEILWEGATVETDNIGNQYIRVAEADPGKPTVMLSAHIDEIGLQLSAKNSKGLWEFGRIGGIDKKVLEGQHVRCYPDPLGNPNLCIPGIIGKTPIHLESPDERNRVPEMWDLVIDFGEPSISPKPGDPVVFERTWTELGDDLICAPGLDDKAGVWVVLDVLQELTGKDLPFNLVGVLMAQEEVGLRGAKIASRRVNPDLSIDLDVSFASDEGRSMKGFTGEVKLGSGPLLQYGPDKDYQTVRELDSSEVPHQIAITGAGGTNTSAIQEGSDDAKTVLISIPLRNMHTPVEIVSYKDLQGCSKMIVEYLMKIKSKA